MGSLKSVSEEYENLGSDIAALRDDVAKLTSSVTSFLRSQTGSVQGKASDFYEAASDAMSDAQKKMSLTASQAQDRMLSAKEDVGAAVERNPFMAVFIAMTAGLIVGMISRGWK